MKKLSINKIFLYLSLLPYAYIILFAFYSAFAGISYSFLFSSSTAYGFWGFLYAFIFGILQLIYLPVLPVCMIFQFIYAYFTHVTEKEYKLVVRISAIIATILVAGILLYGERVHEYIHTHIF